MTSPIWTPHIDWEPPSDAKPVIVAAAVWWENTDAVLVSARHWDASMHKQFHRLWAGAIIKANFTEVQGFIDQWGRFYDREAAYQIAHANGQIKQKTGNPDKPVLYSEDLY